MSWDVTIYASDEPVSLEREPVFQSMGTNTVVRQRIATAWPRTRWKGTVGTVTIDGARFEITLVNGANDAVDAINLSIRGGADVFDALQRLCEPYGWRAFDCNSGETLDLASSGYGDASGDTGLPKSAARVLVVYQPKTVDELDYHSRVPLGDARELRKRMREVVPEIEFDRSHGALKDGLSELDVYVPSSGELGFFQCNSSGPDADKLLARICAPLGLVAYDMLREEFAFSLSTGNDGKRAAHFVDPAKADETADRLEQMWMDLQRRGL